MPYIRSLADQFGLKDWQIRVDDDDPRDESFASVWIADYRKEAVVHLSDKFLEASREEQRETILHELVHVHFHMILSCVPDSINARIEPYMEFGTDSVAVAIARHYPLPQIKRPKAGA